MDGWLMQTLFLASWMVVLLLVQGVSRCVGESRCVQTVDILVGWGGERDSNKEGKNQISDSIRTKKVVKGG